MAAMTRRTACLTLLAVGAGGLRAPRAVAARPARIAWVSIDPPNPENAFLAAFRTGMRALGYTEGTGLVVETWWGEGAPERLRKLVPEIVASRPDVIVAAGGPAVRPFVEANVGVPVVFTFSGDVVLGKVVQSWARPGVNRTGVSFFALEMIPKRVALLKELLPGLKRVAFVGWPPHAGEALEIEAAAAAADKLGLQHRYHGAHTPAELDAAFDAIVQWKADAVMAFAGGITGSHPDRFAAFALRHRIPTVSAWGVFAEKGNVLAYGPVLTDSYLRLASHVDRVLKGAKPSEMPVERPTKFELVVNMKTAKALGLAIPSSLQARVDRVVE